MTKKILISLGIIGVVAAVTVGLTTAYFSDTETSTGNTFTAGAIDLKIDNESYYNGEPWGETSWSMDELDGHLFFDFEDLKPGDHGEDTISLHVDSNEAWACANITLTGSIENGMTDPESDVDDTWGTWGGELDDNLYFLFWADDGDNVLEDDETILLEGLASNLPQEDGNTGTTYSLADAGFNAWGQQDSGLSPEETYYIGKAWCFGEIAYEPVTQDGSGPDSNQNPGNTSNITCNGQPIGNESQTDILRGDISFYAVQKRNNENFMCDSWNPNPEQCDVPDGSSDTGWSETANHHAFALGAKFGDSDIDRGEPAWYGKELFVQESVEDGNSVIAEENHEWIDGEWYSFTVAYDGDDTASIEVDGIKAEEIDNSGIASPTMGEMTITVKTANDPYNDTGDKVSVKNLQLNGCPINPDNIEAVHPETDRALKYLQFTGLELDSGFVLTGDIMFDWQSTATRHYREAFGMNVDVR
jgi:predicted ribosomally synthesized peptide with SipW-like signal peptide